MTDNLPPVPYSSQITGDDGLIVPVWSDWFRKIFNRVGGNIIDSSQAASGYQELYSGLYLQWGTTASIASGVNSVITFPIPFPKACFVVISCPNGNSASSTAATGQWGTGAYSTTGFTLNNRTSSAYAFSWVALGN